MNGFMKAEKLGADRHSPLLVQLIAQHNAAFGMIKIPELEGSPTPREFVARALINN